MHKDERDALEVLKFELTFIEKGGYGLSTREPWRPKFVFEDSPTCMNYDCKDNPGPCSDCVLMRWVPPERREEKVPCRRIPLGPTGETLDSLYRWGDQREIEEAVSGWLRATIKKLEQERESTDIDHSGSAAPSGKPLSLYERFHPKCANPSCPTAFHWLGGGKFFRFRPDAVENSASQASASSMQRGHDVKHFWICEHCCHVYTLEYNETDEVVLRLRWPELPIVEARTASGAGR